MKKILFIIVLVILAAGWMLLKNKGDIAVNTPMPIILPTETSTPLETSEPSPTATPVVKNIITYSDSGFSPNIITIKKGETVTWKNESGASMWVASAMHPTHKAYPGSGIELCGKNTLTAIFDACKSYGFGESWGFSFSNIGTWKYHNHSSPTHFGTIKVE